MSDADDQAEQQLFTEFLASAQKPAPAPESAAAQNAAFLNAARVTPHAPSSPSRPPAPAGLAAEERVATSSGKLKRPRFSHIDLATRPNPNLARRGDPYEIQPSPEKAVEKPATKPARKSRKRQKRHVVQDAPQQPEPPPSYPDLPEPDVAGHAIPPSTPKAPRPSLRPRKRKSAAQPLASSPRRPQSPGTIGADGEEGAIPQDIPQKTQARVGRKNKSLVPTEDGDSISAEQHQDGTDGIVGNNTVVDQPFEHEEEPPQSAQKPPEQPSEPRQPQKPKHRKIRQLKPSKVTDGLDLSSDDHEGSKAHTNSSRQNAPKSVVEQREHVMQEQDIDIDEPAPTRRRGRPRKASSKPIEKNDEVRQERVAERTAPTEQKRSTRKKTATAAATGRSEPEPEPEPTNNHSATTYDGTNTTRKTSTRENNNQDDSDGSISDIFEVPRFDVESEQEQDEQQDEEAQQNQEEGSDYEDAHLPNIEKVFRFLDSGERDGDCRTNAARAVKQACDAARDVFLDSETTLSEISTTTKFLQTLLANYGMDAELDVEQRKALKIDAYAYVFRHVILHLKALHDWLREDHADLQSSLDAMRIIVPFVTRIVSLKDRVADWRVSVNSRYRGDRLVKDVDNKLIAPLRKVEETYRSSLRSLKETARQKHTHDEALKRVREREEAAERKHEFEELKRKKHLFWVDLHVHRLQVEHDPWRRKALTMNQEYFDEQMARYTNDTDANGVEFERVDVFKKRVAPPARPSSFIDQKDWTDEQMAALLEGLAQFPGPYVFHEMFRNYCGHGRPLRRFGVPEITAKAAEVRSRLLARYQEQDWQNVPKWISKIPALP